MIFSVIIFILFTIAVILYCINPVYSYFFIMLSLVIKAVWFSKLPRLEKWVKEMEPSSSKAEILQAKLIEMEKNRPYQNEFNKLMNSWAKYNSSVIMFSIVIFLFQFEGSLNSSNVFWLLITICLYSSIFDRVDLTLLEKISSNETSKERVLSVVKKVNCTINVILSISTLLIVLQSPWLSSWLIQDLHITFFKDYSNRFYLIAYALLLFMYTQKFKQSLANHVLYALVDNDPKGKR